MLTFSFLNKKKLLPVNMQLFFIDIINNKMEFSCGNFVVIFLYTKQKTILYVQKHIIQIRIVNIVEGLNLGLSFACFHKNFLFRFSY